MFKL
ncbi:hypothetical protein YPPY19_3339, partial [Yersinia pestis PY-19]|jgi:hypothetical protein